MSRTISLTDADSLTLDQICKDFEISERNWTRLRISLVSSFKRTNFARRKCDYAKTLATQKREAIWTGNKTTVKPIVGRINAPRLPNGRYQKLQPLASLEQSQRETTSPTTSSMAAYTSWTSAHDATFTSPMMSSTSTNFTASDLASLIYSSIILDYLKSNSNIELNLRKSIFRKLYYPQLISFVDTTLFAKPLAYKSWLCYLSALCCFDFIKL